MISIFQAEKIYTMKIALYPFETIIKLHTLHAFHPRRQHSSEPVQWKHEVPLLCLMFSLGSDDSNKTLVN